MDTDELSGHEISYLFLLLNLIQRASRYRVLSALVLVSKLKFILYSIFYFLSMGKYPPNKIYLTYLCGMQNLR
jgi:hypothetical protein